MAAADQRRKDGLGRAAVRRLNRTEYENTLRDLFDLPGLSVKDLLPEDGRVEGYDKPSGALELSHVQLAKYMEAADHVLDQAIATQLDRPEVFNQRIYPASQYMFQDVLRNGDAVFLKDMKYDDDTYPLIKDRILPFSVFRKKKFQPYTGSVGVFRHEDDAFLPGFPSFTAIYPGRYRVRLSLWSYHWEKGAVKPALRCEAARLTVNGRVVGYFDAPSLKPTVHETEIWLNRGEFVQFNAASLWRVRVSERKGRAAEYVGPGIAVDWFDLEGPIHAQWPPESHRRLFGDLPLIAMPKVRDYRAPKRSPPRQTKPNGRNGPGKYVLGTVASINPSADAGRLLKDFLPRAFRRPVTDEEVSRYVKLALSRLVAGVSFEDAMRTAYKAALCSPDFLFLREKPGQLDDWALASRLSYFLWNSLPDKELNTLAQQGRLHDAGVLRGQVERMLRDPKSERFVRDFLAQWLDLREIDSTCPDRRLYPEFSPYLRDAMLGESWTFFRELLDKDQASRQIVHSDFAMLNQKLAEHYGIGDVVGTQFRKVSLPAGSHRGGFLTQASVLKVTANGTTTSPVKRGAWVQRKIVGQPPDPPPPDVPAVEPDVRGTTTIREQLAKHRANTACASCHAKIDPPGFALENYDVIGGWRMRYRSLGKGDAPDKAMTGGRGVAYRLGLLVDAAGETARARAFRDVEEFKKILLEDPRQVARNLTEQLVIYATGAPASFADRSAVEQILDRTAPRQYGVRSLVHEIVQSPLFQRK